MKKKPNVRITNVRCILLFVVILVFIVCLIFFGFFNWEIRQYPNSKKPDIIVEII